MTPSDNYIDDVYAFFQNCYHLKDWIKNDPALPASIRSEVEDYVNGTRALSLCADLCNALKHLRLSGSRSKENPSFGQKHYALQLGGGDPIISLRYQVTTTSGTEDAYELAKLCVDAWTEYLRKWGLVPAA